MLTSNVRNFSFRTLVFTHISVPTQRELVKEIERIIFEIRIKSKVLSISGNTTLFRSYEFFQYTVVLHEYLAAPQF